MKIKILKSEECCVCYSFTDNYYFFKCGHSSTCNSCLASSEFINGSNLSCPLCRNKSSL